MAYPQDLVGKFVAYRIDPGGSMTPALAGLKVNEVLPGQVMPANVAVYTTSPAPVMGGHRAPQPAMQMGQHRVLPTALPFTNLNAPWNFTFLKYVAGGVTVAPLTTPVLTGPMSGCYLCYYTRAGVQHLAHVGTANAPDSAESVAAKTDWKAFVARPDVSLVTGGSPFDFFSTAEFQAAMMDPSSIPQVCGYFAGGTAYAMLLAPVPKSKQPPVPLMKVASVKTMTMQPWGTIAALRTFR
jgi:hypothetical protein